MANVENGNETKTPIYIPDSGRITTASKGRQLYELLRADIISGKLPKGSKLPSIRELAKHYEMSNNTVNTVIAMLSNEKLVNIKEGKGTFVGADEHEVHLIGVMLLDFSIGMRVEIDILKYIQNNLPNNYYLSLMNTEDRYDTFCDGLRKLIDMKASGFLIVPPKGKPVGGEQQEAIELLRSRPVVMINRTIEGVNADMYSMNLSKGIERAFEYFTTRGKQKTAIVLHDSPKFVQEEMDAYLKCTHRYQLDYRAEYLIDWSEDTEIIRRKLEKILPEIDSLIAPDHVLYNVQDLIDECGKSIPNDLSLVGINDTAYARMFNPPLTSIVFPCEKIGRHSIQKLVSRIEGKEEIKYKQTNFEPELIFRNT